MKIINQALKFLNKNEIILTFFFIYAILFFLLPPHLIFINQWAGGGDLGSHQLPAYLMRHEIFPALFAWTNRWYFGLPLFTFYFPFPFYLIALFSFLMPLAIAFKLAVMLGIYVLPFSVYFFAKKIGLPSPASAAMFSLFPLVLTSNTIIGGSIQSTFAGEFTHLWSINFLLLFLAFLYEKRRLFLSAFFFVLMTLSHSLSTVFLTAFAVLWYLFAERSAQAFWYYLKLFTLAFLLTAFWLIPFFLYRQYSADPGYSTGKELTNYLYKDKLLWLAFALAALCNWREKNIRFLGVLAFLGVLLWHFLPPIGIWLPRFLAFYYLFLFILASQSFFILGFSRQKFFQFLIALFILFFGLKINANFSALRANYYYAMKPPTLNAALTQIINDLNQLPAGRVINEYSDAVDDFWSPRGMELLPLFTNQNYTGGLYVESAVSSPAAFLLQAEISRHKEQVGNYFQLLPQAEVKPENASEHLKFMSVNYLIINENNDFFASHPEHYELLRADDQNHILYRVKNSEPLVTLAPAEPIVLTQKLSRVEKEKIQIRWFLDGQTAPLVFSSQPIKNWQTAASYEEYKKISSRPLVQLNYPSFSSPSAQISNQKIVLDNLIPGQLHYLKISYFPAWKSKNAEIYFAAPGIMLILPHQKQIEIEYKFITSFLFSSNQEQ